MNTAEYRKYLKSMDRAKLEECLLELYKRQSKRDKEIVELVVTGINENKVVPDKHAAIPNISLLRKKLTQYKELSLRGAFWNLSSFRKISKGIRTILKEVLCCPVRSVVRDEAEALFYDTFLFAMTLTYRFVDNDGSVEWWTGMNDIDLFRSLCGYILSSGYTRENLLKTARASCVMSVGDRTVAFPLQETLVLLLKNGDVRLELLELLEQQMADPETGPEYRLRMGILYLLLNEKEASAKAGLDMICEICGQARAHDVFVLWQSLHS